MLARFAKDLRAEPGVYGGWRDADGSDITCRAEAGWKIMDGVGVAVGRDGR